MAQHEGPSAFFDFANGSAGIMRTTPLQLPASKGYSFATWLRVEEGLIEQQGNGGRALYAMLIKGPDTKGIIAALAGQPKQTKTILSIFFGNFAWTNSMHIAVMLVSRWTWTRPHVR